MTVRLDNELHVGVFTPAVREILQDVPRKCIL